MPLWNGKNPKITQADIDAMAKGFDRAYEDSWSNAVFVVEGLGAIGQVLAFKYQPSFTSWPSDLGSKCERCGDTLPQISWSICKICQDVTAVFGPVIRREETLFP